MKPRFSTFRWVVLAIGWMLAAQPAAATQRALLVGVSELVHQPQRLWLQAPRNDVVLMRTTLLQQGFSSTDIRLLADGIVGATLPDLANIQAALGQLLQQSRPGDFVLLYFSGHGTRGRGPAKPYREPDGLAESFLARDVQGAPGEGAALTGSLRDTEIDSWVQAFLAKNVFVWTVFDTCSAASMTRGVPGAAAASAASDDIRFRGVRADQLEGAAGALAPPGMELPAVDGGARARYVAFFASESHQVTPEMRLPRGAPDAQPQGLLTWSLVQALRRRPATWRGVYEGLLSGYPPVMAELERRFPGRELPSPVAEGSLDAPVFSSMAGPASTQPVWPAERVGSELQIQAGLVDGLDARQRVQAIATFEDGSVHSSPTYATQVQTTAARMALPPSLQQVPSTAAWSVVPLSAPADLALRVRGLRRLGVSTNLDYPASIQEVADPDNSAEIQVQGLGARGYRIDRVGAPGATRTVSDAASLQAHLQSLARGKWLARLQSVAQDGRLDGFEATLEIWNGDRLVRAAPAKDAEAIAPPVVGERAVLGVRNLRGQSLDMMVTGIDALGQTRWVYPADAGESNRFERGTREAPATQRFELPWLGGVAGARLLVLAVPAAPRSAPRLFGLGAGSPGRVEIRKRGAAPPAPPLYSALVTWPGRQGAPITPR